MIRTNTDTAALDQARARSHPLRLALLDLLRTGPQTASQAASALGVNTGATSFHLRQLARYGFIEPAPVQGWREKPWRLTETSTQDAAAALDSRDDERYAQWRARQHRYPRQWRRQAAASYAVYLTPEEIDAVAAGMLDLVAPFFDREHDPSLRPARAAQVALVTRLFPLADPRQVPK